MIYIFWFFFSAFSIVFLAIIWMRNLDRKERIRNLMARGFDAEKAEKALCLEGRNDDAFTLSAYIGAGFPDCDRYKREEEVISAAKTTAIAIALGYKDILVKKYQIESSRVDEFGDLTLESWFNFFERFIEAKIMNYNDEALKRHFDHDFIEAKEIKEVVFNAIVYWAQETSVDDELETPPPSDGEGYELYCKGLLCQAGWDATLTPKTGDKGADILACRGEEKMVVQCKNYKNPIGNKAVQEVYSAKEIYSAQRAIVVAPNGYTKQAKDDALNLDVILCHDNDLLSL